MRESSNSEPLPETERRDGINYCKITVIKKQLYIIKNTINIVKTVSPSSCLKRMDLSNETAPSDCSGILASYVPGGGASEAGQETRTSLVAGDVRGSQ